MSPTSAQNRWRWRMLLLHGCMLLAPAAVLWAESALQLPSIGNCLFAAVLGFEGPACGISHSAQAFLSGHITTALHYHPSGPLIITMLAGMTTYLALVLTTRLSGWSWSREVKIYRFLEIAVLAVLALGWAAKHHIP
jgi:hypothetical protein